MGIKNRSPLLIAFVVAFMRISVVLAQTDAVLSTEVIGLPNPIPTTIDGWDKNASRVKVLIKELTNGGHTFVLGGKFQELDGKLTIRTNNDYIQKFGKKYSVGQPPLMTPSLLISGDEVKLFTDPAGLIFEGELADQVKRTGTLPEGRYALCLWAIDVNPPYNILSEDIGPVGYVNAKSCRAFDMLQAGLPKTSFPLCGSKLENNLPVFGWIPPARALVSTKYKLTICRATTTQDLNDPEATLDNALIETGQKWEISGISGNGYMYKPSDPKIEEGKSYIWRVQAYDNASNTSFKNDGKSEVCIFLTKGNSTNDCPTITNSSPSNGGRVNYKKGDNILFKVRFSEIVNQEAIHQVKVYLYKLKVNQKFATIEDKQLINQNNVALLSYQNDGGEIRFKSNDFYSSLELQDGEQYAWQAEVIVDQENLRINTNACGYNKNYSIKSLLTAFSTGSCVSLTNNVPTAGGNVTDVNALFKVKLGTNQHIDIGAIDSVQLLVYNRTNKQEASQVKTEDLLHVSRFSIKEFELFRSSGIVGYLQDLKARGGNAASSATTDYLNPFLEQGIWKSYYAGLKKKLGKIGTENVSLESTTLADDYTEVTEDRLCLRLQNQQGYADGRKIPFRSDSKGASETGLEPFELKAGNYAWQVKIYFGSVAEKVSYGENREEPLSLPCGGQRVIASEITNFSVGDGGTNNANSSCLELVNLYPRDEKIAVSPDTKFQFTCIRPNGLGKRPDKIKLNIYALNDEDASKTFEEIMLRKPDFVADYDPLIKLKRFVELGFSVIDFMSALAGIEVGQNTDPITGLLKFKENGLRDMKNPLGRLDILGTSQWEKKLVLNKYEKFRLNPYVIVSDKLAILLSSAAYRAAEKFGLTSSAYEIDISKLEDFYTAAPLLLLPGQKYVWNVEVTYENADLKEPKEGCEGRLVSKSAPSYFEVASCIDSTKNDYPGANAVITETTPNFKVQLPKVGGSVITSKSDIKDPKLILFKMEPSKNVQDLLPLLAQYKGLTLVSAKYMVDAMTNGVYIYLNLFQNLPTSAAKIASSGVKGLFRPDYHARATYYSYMSYDWIKNTYYDMTRWNDEENKLRESYVAVTPKSYKVENGYLIMEFPDNLPDGSTFGSFTSGYKYAWQSRYMYVGNKCSNIDILTPFTHFTIDENATLNMKNSLPKHLGTVSKNQTDFTVKFNKPINIKGLKKFVTGGGLDNGTIKLTLNKVEGQAAGAESDIKNTVLLFPTENLGKALPSFDKFGSTDNVIKYDPAKPDELVFSTYLEKIPTGSFSYAMLPHGYQYEWSVSNLGVDCNVIAEGIKCSKTTLSGTNDMENGASTSGAVADAQMVLKSNKTIFKYNPSCYNGVGIIPEGKVQFELAKNGDVVKPDFIIKFENNALKKNDMSRLVKIEIYDNSSLKKSNELNDKDIIFTRDFTDFDFDRNDDKILIVKNNMLDDSWRELIQSGGKYAWRATLAYRAEPKSCDLFQEDFLQRKEYFDFTTDPVLFEYEGCLNLANSYPAQSQKVKVNDIPFTATFSKPIKNTAITKTKLVIYKMEKGQTAMQAMQKNTIWYEVQYSSSDEGKSYLYDSDEASAGFKDLTIYPTKTGKKLNFENGTNYAWFVIVDCLGNSIVKDGSCKLGAGDQQIRSIPTCFTYGAGCVDIQGVSPKNDKKVGTSTSLIAKANSAQASVDYSLANQAVVEICKIDKSEVAADLENDMQANGRFYAKKTFALSDKSISVDKKGNIQISSIDAVLGENKLTLNERYAWRITLNYDLQKIGLNCNSADSVAVMPIETFVYSPCTVPRNIEPANKDVINSQTPDFKIRLSSKIPKADLKEIKLQVFELDAEHKYSDYPDWETAIGNNHSGEFKAFISDNSLEYDGQNLVIKSPELKDPTGKVFVYGIPGKNRYYWKVFVNGKLCAASSESTLGSSPTWFTYGGCIKLTNENPAHKSSVDAAFKEFEVRLDKKIKFTDLKSVNLNLAPLENITNYQDVDSLLDLITVDGGKSFIKKITPSSTNTKNDNVYLDEAANLLTIRIPEQNFKNEKGYLWNVEINFDGTNVDSCSAMSEFALSPKTLFYGSCKTMHHVKPEEEVSTDDPKFSFQLTPETKLSDIEAAYLSIWKRNPDKTDKEILKTRPNTVQFLSDQTSENKIIEDEIGGVKVGFVLQPKDLKTYSLEIGSEYIYRLEVILDKKICDISLFSGEKKFWYYKGGMTSAKKDNGCFDIQALSPLHNDNYADDLVKFKTSMVTNFSMKGIKKYDGFSENGIKAGFLRVWEVEKGKTIDEAMKQPAAFTYDFKGIGSIDRINNSFINRAKNYIMNWGKGLFDLPIACDTMDLEYKCINGDKMKCLDYAEFKAKENTHYVWRVQYVVDSKIVGTIVDKNGADVILSCRKDTILSDPFEFDYKVTGTGECDGSKPCEAPAISDKTPGTETNFVGKTIRVGLFAMKVTKATGSATGLTGEGIIKLHKIKSPILVAFSNIKVNKDMQMYDGFVSGKQDPNSGVATTIIDKAATAGGKKLGLNESEAKGVAKAIIATKRVVSMLASDSPIGLPYGYDEEVNGKRYTLGIIGLKFTPTKASMNCVMEFSLPELEDTTGKEAMASLGFGVKDLCISPYSWGASGGTMKLYLAGDTRFPLGGGAEFRFVGCQENELDKDDKGTYIKLNCGKFDGIRVEGGVQFPRDWMVPVDNNGNVMPTGKAEARFATFVKDWNDWYLEANMDRALIPDENGFGFEVTKMFYDHSDSRNLANMKFPNGYAGDMNNTWRGFYLEKIALSLPKDIAIADTMNKPITFAVEGMLVDKTGLSGRFEVQNLLSKGDMNGWGISIKNIGLEIVSNSFKQGYLNGAIKLPVSDDALAYSAILQRNVQRKNMEFQFQIKPEDNKDYTANFWKAKLRIDKTSSITVGNFGGRFNAKADLTGDLSISDSSMKLNLPKLKFENFVVQAKPDTSKGEKYISCAKFSLTSPAKQANGFPISLEKVTPKFDGDRIGLGFSITVSLAPGATSIGGAADLEVWAKMKTAPKQQLEFDKVKMTKLKLDVSTGTVDFKGFVEMYDKDPVYGDGFKGMIDVTIIKTINVKVCAQFGQVDSKKNPGTQFRYWYVDAYARFMPGIMLSPLPLGIYGFGGGAWYHMAPANQVDPKLLLQAPDKSTAEKNMESATSSIGANVSGAKYIPNEETWFGFKAGITFGTAPDPKTANGDIMLSMSFTSSGGLERVQLDGGMYLATDIVERKDPALSAKASIIWDNVHSIFHGQFDVDMNFKIIKGGGNMVFHFEPDWWQVKIGEPAYDKRFKLNLDLAILKMNLNFYLMTGQRLPPLPDPPPQVMEVINKSPELAVKFKNSSGMLKQDSLSGFMMGLGIQIGPVGGDFLCFYGSFDGASGFDIEVKKYNDLFCSNDPTMPIGFNGGWYAQGQVWAYLKAELGIKINIFGGERKFSILDLQAALLMRAGAPNPIWVEGFLAGRYSILNGLISGTMSYHCKFGQECTVAKGDPFSETPIIADISPKDGSSDNRINSLPTVSYNFPLNKNIQLPDLNDSKLMHVYQVKATPIYLKEKGGASVQGTTEGINDYDATSTRLKFNKALAPFKTYELSTSVYVNEYLNGSWVRAQYPDKGVMKPIEQNKSTTYTTGSAPNYLESDFISNSYPVNRMRFFLKGEHGGKGYVYVQPDLPNVLQTQDDGVVYQKLVARFTDIKNGIVKETDAVYTGSNSQAQAVVNFKTDVLENQKIYKMELLRVSAYKNKGGGASGLLEKIDSTEENYSDKISTGLDKYGAVEGSNQGEDITLSRKTAQRKLGGVYLNAATGGQEKVIYTCTFATSRYNTLAEKLGGMTIKKIDRDRTYDNIELHFNAVEPFDATTTWLTTGTQAYPEQSWAINFAYPQVWSRPYQTDFFAGGIRQYTYFRSDNGQDVTSQVPGGFPRYYLCPDHRSLVLQIYDPTKNSYIDGHTLLQPLQDNEVSSGNLNPFPPTIDQLGGVYVFDGLVKRPTPWLDGNVIVSNLYGARTFNLARNNADAAMKAMILSNGETALWGRDRKWNWGKARWDYYDVEIKRKIYVANWELNFLANDVNKGYSQYQYMYSGAIPFQLWANRYGASQWELNNLPRETVYQVLQPRY